MEDKEEQWKHLAALAANEQDSDKLLVLVSEINRLLLDKSTERTTPAEE